MHRIIDDGRVPEDNPFVKTPGAYPTIWSYGHRNPQGLAQHPATGELYDAEHGPRGGDELNLVLPGRNYGWPVITYGMNYDGTPMTNLTAKEGMEQPVTYWTPSIAVCAIDFYAGDRFPRWKNDLLVSSLAAEELRRLRIDGGKRREAGGAVQGRRAHPRRRGRARRPRLPRVQRARPHRAAGARAVAIKQRPC